MNGLVQHTIMQRYSITSSARGAPSRPACALLSFRLHDARADRWLRLPQQGGGLCQRP